MPKVVKSPTLKKAQGNKDKLLKEFIGRVNTGNTDLSVALMNSPEGWEEPGQTPEFDEYTIVLRGMLKVETENGTYEVRENQSMVVERDKWVKYSTPEAGGADYIAICVPAFSPEMVHRDDH